MLVNGESSVLIKVILFYVTTTVLYPRLLDVAKMNQRQTRMSDGIVDTET